MPFEKIFENGIIKLKNEEYIKIIKIIPINYNLKSELEKKSILNSYKSFLKTCNFDLQILIQSKKEDLSKNISIINSNKLKEKIKEYSNDYIEYINYLNKNKYSSTKNFYLIIKNKNLEKNNNEDIIFDDLNDKYFKIKESLSRCGNVVYNIIEKQKIEKILFSFLNVKEELI